MSLFNELKRRNVIKVSVAYLALGWVVIEVSNTVVPLLHLPEFIPATLLWIGLAGFPFAVMFSWVFELTPDGLKRESEIDRSQSITHVTGKRLEYIIIALMVVGIGLAVLQYLRSPAASTAVEALAPVSTSAAVPNAPVSPAAAPSPEQPAASAPDEKSIAVLPFADMSQGKDQEYFSDGISEELLNLLAKIPELKVIARTSSFSYKGKDVKVEQIGQELHVAHVLEGSVRKSGNMLRITTQLVRTSDSSHLWSETYDRPLDDIFVVQDEIAGAVVEQLRVKLLGAVPRVRKANPEAYTLFLQAVQLDRQYTQAGLAQSIVLYQRALAIDPTYAAAWHGLAGNYSNQAFLGHGPRSADENFRLAREASEKALAIDPDYAPAHANLAWIAMRYDDDLPAAARHLEHALALTPADPYVVAVAVQLVLALGRLNTAIELSGYVAAHDPVNPGGHSRIGDSCYRAGRLEESIDSYRAVLSLEPASIEAHYFIGVALLLRGDAQAALKEIQTEPEEAWRLTGLALVYHVLGKKAESDAALAELIEKHEKSWSSTVAWVHAFRGDADRAFEWMDKAVANHDTAVMNFPNEPLLASLHTDPRWLPFLRKIGKAPEQLAAIKFDVKVPQQ